MMTYRFVHYNSYYPDLPDKGLPAGAIVPGMRIQCETGRFWLVQKVILVLGTPTYYSIKLLLDKE